jgi:hypothetical protein
VHPPVPGGRLEGVPAIRQPQRPSAARRHDAARVLYDNHRALELDVLAAKLDTLRVDLAVELENRVKPLAPVGEGPAPGG